MRAKFLIHLCCKKIKKMETELKNRKNKNIQNQNSKNNKPGDKSEPSEYKKHPLLDGALEELRDLRHEDVTSEEKRDSLPKSSEKSRFYSDGNSSDNPRHLLFNINFSLDLVAISLFLFSLGSRLYHLEEPRSIVFDELHYGKYVSLYMKRIFFFDSQPPLGKQLISAAANFAGFDGEFKFDRIGSSYAASVPLFALRLVPALSGAALPPVVYLFMLQLGMAQWTAAAAASLILFDNAILTQSRFILMEPMLLLLAVTGLLCIQKFVQLREKPFSASWWLWLTLGALSLTAATCIKFIGACSLVLGAWIVWRDAWKLLPRRDISTPWMILQMLARGLVLIVVPAFLYVAVFHIHLTVLSRAGPHDSVMSSAFQASLEGGLASITKGQPLQVAHGSQITLRHSHGRTCWLHSHPHVYPLRYPDKRGSSHQQQVTCYSFKDVNNWWIVKRPDRSDLVVSRPVDAIRDGDIVQLVHGITSRALNSHDVAAAMSPQNQEVTCYIDYNVSMPAQNLWKIEIVNKDQVGDVWHTIESLVRLVHVNSTQALKFSGRQLPDWGFNQHEVVTDRVLAQEDTVWNVEEHRYTTSEDQKERERDLVQAEMIPTRPTHLSFWDKFWELQNKMLFSSTDSLQHHLYSSEPLEWPLMTRGIAYWVSTNSNAQVHLLGNVAVWYAGSASLVLYCGLLVWYLLRRRRKCFDISEVEWQRYCKIGEVLLAGYVVHMIPYFCMERTLFLHHYLPALLFKILLTAALTEHFYYLARVNRLGWLLKWCVRIVILTWLVIVLYTYRRFLPLSYGSIALSARELLDLRWKESWDFIVHRQASAIPA